MRYIAFFLLALTTSCSYFVPNPPCPPPPSAKKPITDTYSCTEPTTPAVIPDQEQILTLCELVDLGLQNSPKTRAYWYRAKEAAANLGLARSAYIPPVFFHGLWLREQFSAVDLNIESLNHEKRISFGLGTTYLLFDFGGRNANLAMALAALSEANWIYNWEVQTVMIGVIKNYYSYVNAIGILEADVETVKDYEVTLEAARALRVKGAKGLSDELQAHTNLIRSQIDLETSFKRMNVAYASLVQSVGLPPDTPLSTVQLPEQLETSGICDDMALLLQAAKENRGDLKAGRAVVLEQRAKIRAARSQFLPKLTTDSSAARTTLNNLTFLNNFRLQFNLDFPIFNSFYDVNDLERAQAQLLEAQAILDDEELQAYLEVLTDYYEFVASTSILKHSCTYIETAEKNQEVALANYKAGITTIVDVMMANNSLNTARLQLVDAKTNFLTSIANLAYDTGGLTISDVNPNQTVTPNLIDTGEVLDAIVPCEDSD